MKLLLLVRLFGKLLLPGMATIVLLVTQVFQPRSIPGKIDTDSLHKSDIESAAVEGQLQSGFTRFQIPETTLPAAVATSFGNPAGCSASVPVGSVEDRLANVQRQLGDSLDLGQSLQPYIWNGPLNMMVNVAGDTSAFEFVVNQFQPPYTYKADQTATIFLNNGFVVWFRSYGDAFRLLAVPIMDGVYESVWGEYVRAYWQEDGIPTDRQYSAACDEKTSLPLGGRAGLRH
jgi:hypothetical protein